MRDVFRGQVGQLLAQLLGRPKRRRWGRAGAVAVGVAAGVVLTLTAGLVAQLRTKRGE
ncbi:MAG: hypothetical protein ACRDTZ_00895 [Pseudonocardiaceae bacterium]